MSEANKPVEPQHTEPVYTPEIDSAIPIEITPADTSYGEGSITIPENASFKYVVMPMRI